MKFKKLLTLLLTSIMLPSCGTSLKASTTNKLEEVIHEEVLEPDTTVYGENKKVDLRAPAFRSGDDEEEAEESYVVDKVILHYYNEDGNCNKEGKNGRAFFVWSQGFDGEEYSDEYNNEPSRVEYSNDGTLMTITIDLVNDVKFKDFYGANSIMYIIKYKMGSPKDLNWGGQSEDVELKYSEFNPKDKVVEVWSTPAAGGGIAQFDSEEKTKVEGVKLAKFTNWKTLSCTMSANTTTVNWELYAFDETYFKVRPKNREAIKKNYKVSEGVTSSKSFTIPFTYNAHINAVYCIESWDQNGVEGLKKVTYVSFEDLYMTQRFEKYYTYPGNDLGVTYTPEETTFKVWSPVAANISLYLYESDTATAYGGNDKYKGWHMNYQPGGIWTLTVKGDLAHDSYKYYNYYVDTWSTSGVCMDPYATACGACGLRGMVYDKTETNPSDWDDFSVPAISTPQELTIYEVHVQDFTADESWNGPEEERGTYNGFVRSGTRLASDPDVKTGFDHLKELGVGAVQFVPVFDSDNDEVTNKKYNWGYNPLNYNCVEGVYSSNPHNGLTRISEFKNMVNELSKAGMRTIMDVVYNHVSSPTASCFNKLMPRYYFRYAKEGDAEVAKGWIKPGELYDGSGCHNEFKSESTMGRKFIVDSVCMWAKEYNIKGFRFDLMALIDGATMKAVKVALGKIDPSIYVYGEGWTADRFHGKKTYINNTYVDSYGTFAVPGYDEHGLDNNHGYQVYTSPELYTTAADECYLGAFDGSGRDALKGSNDKGGGYPNYGFISQGRNDISDGTLEQIQHVVWGERADGQGGNPKQVVAYASCHDNMTLRDHLYFTLGNEGEGKAPSLYDVMHAMMAVETVIFASNSAAFMLGGEELMRTKEIIPEGANKNVTDEEFEKIPATSYVDLYGHLTSHNSYNSPINVNSFKWDNKVSVYDEQSGADINMKSENLTSQFAKLIALHKEMPKYSLEELNKYREGGTTTKGVHIDGIRWNAGNEWNDKAGVGVQFDDWFIFIAARNFVYFKNDVTSWGDPKVTAGTVDVDKINISLNLGSETYQNGFAAAVYER